MATVTRENIGLLNDKITVRVDKDDYLQSFEKSLKNFSKNANIPGFRKGMVPTGMIKKMHGQAVFTDEVLKTVEKELTNFMQTEQLEIFAQPLPMEENSIRKMDVNQPEEYNFAFEVGLKPAFSIPDLSQLSVDRYKVEVTDEMIQQELERLQTRHGKMNEPETVENDENVLNISFTETDAEGKEIEGGIKKDNSLLVKYFTPAVREQLKGKRKDDSITIFFPEAFEGKEKEWLSDDLGIAKDDEASQNKHFNLLITKIGHVEKPAFDEEFFNAAFPNKQISNEEELRQNIKSEIEAYWESQSKNHLQHEIYHLLIEQTPIDFPESFLKKWMQNGGEQPKSAEEVEKEFPSFVNQLKWTLITDSIVKEQNLQIAPEDLRLFAKKQLFSYMGMNTMDDEQPWITEYVNKMMQDKKFVEDSYHRIITEKIFDWAEGVVSEVQKPISAEDFTKILQEHQHHQH